MSALRPIYTQAAWTLAPNKHWSGLVSQLNQAGEALTRTTQIFSICMRNKSTNISAVFNVFRNSNKIF